MADNEESIFEREWNKQTATAEDNSMALTVSFTFVQAIRFHISNSLPDKEGSYTPEILRDKFDGGSSAGCLMFFGITLIFAAFLCGAFIPEKEKTIDDIMSMSDESEHGESPRDGSHGESPRDGSPRYATRHGCWESIKENWNEIWEEIKERGNETMVLTAGMGFAWSVFFSSRWFVSNLSFVTLSSKKLPDVEKSPDMEIVAIITALTLSFASFIAIFMLDYAYDRVGEQSSVGKALLKSIESIGVLVGFAWEQCFDNSIHSIASASAAPHVVRFVLAFVSVCLVAPAWKIYLLPMAYHYGWKFGFVPTETKVREAITFFQQKQRNAETFEKHKKGHHHSHHHHHHTSEQHEEQWSSFLLMDEEDGASVLQENVKLKAQIEHIEQRSRVLNAYCREHVAIMSSTISGIVSPLAKVEQGLEHIRFSKVMGVAKT